MADDNQIGLEAVFDDSEFEKGIAAYNAAISDADEITQSSAASMENAMDSMAQGITQSFEAVAEEVPPAAEEVTAEVKTVGDEAVETAKKTRESTDTMTSAWDGLASVGAASWAALGVAIAGATAAMYLAIDAAVESDSVMAELEFQIGKTGESTGITKQQALDLADSLSKITPIDDEVITQAITMGMRFDGVTKDNIEPLLKAAADLSVSTGKSLPASMKELALAISDPDKATRLLRDANITLTDAELETLKGFKDTGNAAGAAAFLFDRINGKIGGLAEAMEQTAKGKMTIFQTALGNISETFGGAFIESIKDALDKLTEFASDPRILNFVSNIGIGFGNLATTIVNSLPDISITIDAVLSTIEGIPAFFKENEPIVVGVLASLGVAMLAFGVNATIGFAPVIAAALPVIAVMGVIAGVVAIVYRAWTENWGGIQEKVAAAWDQMRPTFEQLQAWLNENLPIAIENLSRFWQETLLPAIVTVVGWIVDNVLPALVQIVQWLGTNVPIAIAFLSDLWTNTLLPAIAQVSDFFTETFLPAVSSVVSWVTDTLIPAISNLANWFSVTLAGAIKTASAIWTTVFLPAITNVWNFINKNIIPLFQAIANVMNAVVGLAVRTLAGLWQNVLLPALDGIWNFIDTNIIPIFEAIGGVISDNVRPAISDFASWLTGTALALFAPFSEWLSGVFLVAWNGIEIAIQAIITLLNDLANILNNLVLPTWLTPGSPTPFEMGLIGINKQLSTLANATLPAVRYQLDVIGSVRDVQSMAGRGSGSVSNISNTNQSTNNYLFGTRISVENQSNLSTILQGSV